MKKAFRFFRIKTMRCPLLFAKLCLSSLAGFGQSQSVVLQVGDADSSSSELPTNVTYTYSYTQQIYTATELSAAGLWAGCSIEGLGFNLLTAISNTNFSQNWTIYVGQIATESFAGATPLDWIPMANLNEVFSGTVSSTTTGWHMLEFDVPFVWDGTSNLVVAVDENDPGNYSLGARWEATAQAVNRIIYYRSYIINPDPTSPPTATGLSALRPNIRFEIAQGPCTGLSLTPGNTLTTTTSLCSGASTTLNVANSYIPYYGMDYQWQQSTDGTTWNNISGANSFTNNVSWTGITAWYRLGLSCNNGAVVYSAPALIAHVPNFQVQLADSVMAVCDGSTVTLTATGADSFFWSPQTGLDTNIGATVMATVTEPTTYTVIGTNSVGCQQSNSILLQPISTVNPTPENTLINNCASGQVITLSANPLSLGSGAAEYELRNAADSVIFPWQASPDFTLPQIAAGNYLFNVYSRIVGCAVSSEAGEIEVFNGLNATVNPIIGQCSDTSAMIVLSDPTGAGIAFDSVSETFTQGSTDTNIVLYGAASFTNGRGVITPSATGVSGALSFPGPGEDFDALALHFDLSTDLPINNFGTGGADGIAWCFGDDAAYSSTINNGAGTRLRLVFDGADNGSQNGNAKGIYLVYGYSLNSQMGPTTQGVLAYSNYLAWKGQTDKPVSIYISAQNDFTLIYDGTIIFDKVPLPSSFATEDKTDWYHFFTGFTGGDAMRHAIDNLEISYRKANFVYGMAAGGSGALPTTWLETDTLMIPNTPDSVDLWMAFGGDPTSCNQFLGTYAFLYPLQITNIEAVPESSCGAQDAYLSITGLVANRSYQVNFEKNGVPDSLVLTSDTTGTLVIGGLQAATFDDIAVSLDSCTVIYPNQVTIPALVQADIATAVLSENTSCQQPNGQLAITAPTFVVGESYQVVYNDSVVGTYTVGSNAQLVLSNLPAGNYTNIYVVSAQNCHSDTIPTLLLPGVSSGAVITAAAVTNPSTCSATDGQITLSGTFSNSGFAFVTFSRNGYNQAALATGSSGQLAISGLGAGVYEAISVVDGGCPSAGWGPVTLSDGSSVASIASVSSATAQQQGANLSLNYLNSTCERIINITATDSLSNVTAIVTVNNNAQTFNGTEPYVGRYFDITASNNVGGTVTLYFSDADINAYNSVANTLANPLYPPIDANGNNLLITAYHSTVPGSGPANYDLNNAELITPNSVVHHTAEGVWEVSFSTNSFSGFFAHTNTSNVPLPIAKLDAQANHEGSYNEIEWTAESLAIGDVFTVTRSDNGRDFSPIGTVVCDDSKAQKFTWIDDKYISGLNYYRIEWLRSSGQRLWSKVLQVDATGEQLELVALPNPMLHELRIVLSGEQPLNQGHLVILDASGRLVEQRTTYGAFDIRLRVAHLPSGIYFIRYQNTTDSRSLKITKD